MEDMFELRGRRFDNADELKTKFNLVIIKCSPIIKWKKLFAGLAIFTALLFTPLSNLGRCPSHKPVYAEQSFLWNSLKYFHFFNIISISYTEVT